MILKECCQRWNVYNFVQFKEAIIPEASNAFQASHHILSWVPDMISAGYYLDILLYNHNNLQLYKHLTLKIFVGQEGNMVDPYKNVIKMIPTQFLMLVSEITKQTVH